MYTQEIVCPACGKLARVNILDAEGASWTQCMECPVTIGTGTDADGKVCKIGYKAPGKLLPKWSR